MQRTTQTPIERIPIDQIVEFKKWGDTFTRVAHNPATDVFIFQRVTDKGRDKGRVLCLEVVRPRLRAGIRCYPASEEFGKYGRCIDNTPAGRAKAEKLLREGW